MEHGRLIGQNFERKILRTYPISSSQPYPLPSAPLRTASEINKTHSRPYHSFSHFFLISACVQPRPRRDTKVPPRHSKDPMRVRKVKERNKDGCKERKKHDPPHTPPPNFSLSIDADCSSAAGCIYEEPHNPGQTRLTRCPSMPSFHERPPIPFFHVFSSFSSFLVKPCSVKKKKKKRIGKNSFLPTASSLSHHTPSQDACGHCVTERNNSLLFIASLDECMLTETCRLIQDSIAPHVLRHGPQLDGDGAVHAAGGLEADGAQDVGVHARPRPRFPPAAKSSQAYVL